MYFSRTLIVLIILGVVPESVKGQLPEMGMTIDDFVINQNGVVNCDPRNPNTTRYPFVLLMIHRNGAGVVSYLYLSGAVSVLSNHYSFSIAAKELTITGLTCDDAGIYYCSVNFFNGTTGLVANSQEKNMTVRVPPTLPKELTISPSTQTIKEFTAIKASCNANLGGPIPAKIVWRIYRKGVAEDILPGDSRIIGPLKVALDDGDEPCTVRYMSELQLLNVTRDDQDLVFACFVVEEGSSTPATCEGVVLCEQSKKITILYPVDGIAVSKAPTGPVLVGRSVVLSCQADGFPAPSYSWSKSGENGTLEDIVTGGISQVTLRDTEIEKDSGNYNCTASNQVLGNTYYTSEEVLVNIVATPPPTTSTTPATTSEGEVETSTPSPVKGDDDNTVIIVVVVIVVVVALVIAGVIIFFILKRRGKKVDEPAAKQYNNQPTLSFHNTQPDLVADEKKYHASLNNSFDPQNEDGLMYADLTYDNRPRSRKPMAIGDTASEYSDVQMPQV